MFGVLTIAVRIYQDRWGYGIYSGPIGSAVFIITVKWVSGLKMTVLCSSIFFIIIPSSSSFYTFCLLSVLCCFSVLPFCFIFNFSSLTSAHFLFAPFSFSHFSLFKSLTIEIHHCWLLSVCSVDIIAISAAEDEAAEGGVSGEDRVHAAGRPRLLLRCSRPDAALLFWGDKRIISLTKWTLLRSKVFTFTRWNHPICAVYQEWDYAYVHSFYHLSLAVSFVLLLPKKNRFAGTGQNAAKLSCFTLCFCVCYKLMISY